MSMSGRSSEKRSDKRLQLDILDRFDDAARSVVRLSPKSPLRSRSNRSPSPSPDLSVDGRSGTLPFLSNLPGPPDIIKRRLPRSFSFFMTPRVIASVLGWVFSLYLVYEYLLPLYTHLPTLEAGSPRPVVLPEYLNSARPDLIAVPPRIGNDHLDSIDPRWRPYSPLEPQSSFPTLRPTRFLPERCMEEFFLYGETNCTAEEVGPEERLDAVWFWVNGTDPRWIESQREWKDRAGIQSPEKHFRENNELVYSIRSVLAALPGKIQNAHLISADYPFRIPENLKLLDESMISDLEKTARSWAKRVKMETPDYSGLDLSTRTGTVISKRLAHYLSSTWRVAQTPTWLDFSHRDLSSPYHPFAESSRFSRVDNRGPLTQVEVNYPNFRYATHSEIFHLPTSSVDGLGSSPDAEKEDERFGREALPTFNSMAIESRVGWLPGLANISLTLNDDFFIMRKHAVSDFYSPFYGTILRLDTVYGMQVPPKLDPELVTEGGENGGLFHANWILSQRFPMRLRHYAAHVPKVIPKEINHEVALMFRQTLDVSGMKKFREMALGDGDVQSLWLTMHMQVERWREALLWTYIVANLGHSSGGVLGSNAKDQLRQLLKIDENSTSSQVTVVKGARTTLRDGRMETHLRNAGWEPPLATSMMYSSMDGYLPTLQKPGMRPNTNAQCTIDLPKCFGTFWTDDVEIPAEEMFKHLTFGEWECGDCLINAVVTASGPLGLSAFFPPAEASYSVPRDHGHVYEDGSAPPPHLPITPTWQEADFSLTGVMNHAARPGEAVGLRLWCMKLLSRYLFVSGRSNVRFHQLMNEGNTRGTLRTVDVSRATSFLGLNDDIERDYEAVLRILGTWFEKKWPRKAVWERGWKRDVDWIKDEGGDKEEFVAW